MVVKCESLRGVYYLGPEVPGTNLNIPEDFIFAWLVRVAKNLAICLFGTLFSGHFPLVFNYCRRDSSSTTWARRNQRLVQRADC
jgi:hypothetical protein